MFLSDIEIIILESHKSHLPAQLYLYYKVLLTLSLIILSWNENNQITDTEKRKMYVNLEELIDEKENFNQTLWNFRIQALQNKTLNCLLCEKSL